MEVQQSPGLHLSLHLSQRSSRSSGADWAYWLVGITGLRVELLSLKSEDQGGALLAWDQLAG